MKLSRSLKRELVWIRGEYGLITPFFMILMRVLQYIPPQICFGNRTDHYYKKLLGKRDIEKRAIARKRAIIIDIMMLVFIAIEIAIPNLIESRIITNRVLEIVILIILLFRLVDIIQVNVNMILFDATRFKDNRVAKFTRAIILIAINYFEIILIFGFIYFLFHENICCYESIIDAYYFSTITQLTIGFGDLHPTHWLKIIAGLQGIIGTSFLVLIIAKIINVIPNLKDLDKK